ncbi:LCP family protein [Streptomyces sp. Ru72]|uniref:LCP family protein n=1 Tax=Streptomyces sp. Ru72 TaxID=2080747 RepID=UPI000CDE29FD|nr:LCP family protein [Streptomyces sp. Ru72]POX54388.1 LytR family transcriptional regulator [Streptomyces sp. Ru72]
MPIPAEVSPVPTPARPPARREPVRRSPAKRPPVRPRKRGWPVRMTTTLSVVVLVAAGIGHAVITSLDSGISRIDPFRDMKNRPAAGNGMNVLLVGTDGRDRITERERRAFHLGGEPCHCTDTIMIVHISADRERATVVSLPRDSYAEVPEHTDEATGQRRATHPVRLNAAYAEGGPNLTVRTVEDMTHLKIDHYLEVDFISFMRTVDVLGGVRVCTTQPLKDTYTGLDLGVGTHLLGGGQALQYVRSRHVDGASDLGRMQRQQRFLAALIDRATSSGVLLNPMRLRDVAQAALGAVRADQGFGTDQLLDLGRAMRNFSPRSSEFTTVPIGRMEYEVKGLGSTVKWDDVKAKALFDSLREDRPLAPHESRPKGQAKPEAPGRKPAAAEVEVPPQQIQVRVENGTLTEGLGRRADDGLAAAGFRTTRQPVNAAERGVRRTVVMYDPRWDRSAKVLEAALPGSELRAVPGQGATLRVIVGADFKEVRPVRVRTPEPKASPTPQQAVVTGDQVVCPT